MDHLALDYFRLRIHVNGSRVTYYNEIVCYSLCAVKDITLKLQFEYFQ